MATKFEDRGYELGVAAFKKGLKAVPFHDPVLAQELKWSRHILELLEGWTRGWHTANATELVPVE